MQTYSETSARPVRRSAAVRHVVAAACICASFLQAGDGDEPAGEPIDPIRFLADYRRALHELRATYANVRVDGTVRIVQTAARAQAPSIPEQGKKSPRRPRFEGSDRRFDFSYASCDGKEKGRRAPSGSAGSGREGVAVANGSAQFTASRAGAGRPYAIGHQSKDDGDLKPLSELRLQVRDAPYRPSGLRDFEKYVESPAFSVERVRRVRDAGGRAVISLLVHYRPPTEQELHIEGRLDLDESLGLVIRHYELEHSKVFPAGRVASLYAGTVRYKQEKGAAVPTRVDHSIHPVPETGKTTRWEYAISGYSLGPTPREEFTLAYYGLGDFERTLEQVEKRSTYRTAAVAGAAFLIGLVLLGLGRKVHRARASAKTSAQPRQAPGSPPIEQAP